MTDLASSFVLWADSGFEREPETLAVRESGNEGARQPGTAGARQPANWGSREPGTDGADSSESSDNLEILGRTTNAEVLEIFESLMGRRHEPSGFEISSLHFSAVENLQL